jgi:hemolysin III
LASTGCGELKDVSPRYRRSELLADGVVHVVGLTLGLVACIALALTSLPAADASRLASLGLYAGGLLAMLACSALSNMRGDGPWKGVFRRLDHAAIFVMIAGTYTPFALIAIGGWWGTGLLVFVWTIAVCGVALKLLDADRFRPLSIAAYLLLGWSALVALGPLSAAVSTLGLVLLVSGGVIYSVGVVFYLCNRLPYHRPIWHAFVLAAAACHYAAIVNEVVLAA